MQICEQCPDGWLKCGKHIIVIRNAGTVNGYIYLKAESGDLGKASVFTRHGTYAPLQRIQNILPGHLDHTEHVAERGEAEDITIGDVAFPDADAHAAAVDKGDISLCLIPVSVGAEIRERRQLAIRKDMVDCDYYRMLNGDIENDQSPTAQILFPS